MTLLAVLSLLSSAQATTAQVCVRNDGDGTFRTGSLMVTADTQGTDHDASGSGPPSALGPSGHGCISLSGLRATDPGRPETAYTFTVGWLDGAGTNSVTAAPVILDVDKYVGQAGAHSYYLDPSSYIGLVNTPPTAAGDLTVSFGEGPRRCAGTVEPAARADEDFGTYRLQRADDDGSWTDLDAWQTHVAFAFTDTGMNTTEDTRYRAVAEDQYGAQTLGPDVVCVGSADPDAADSGGAAQDGSDGTDGTAGGSGDGADGTQGADGAEDSTDGWTPRGGDSQDATETQEDEDNAGCRTIPPGPGSLVGMVVLGAAVVARRRPLRRVLRA